MPQSLERRRDREGHHDTRRTHVLKRSLTHTHEWFLPKENIYGRKRCCDDDVVDDAAVAAADDDDEYDEDEGAFL